MEYIIAPAQRSGLWPARGKLQPGRLNAGDGLDGHNSCNTYARTIGKSKLEIMACLK
jgi:hypothetical protein